MYIYIYFYIYIYRRMTIAALEPCPICMHHFAQPSTMGASYIHNFLGGNIHIWICTCIYICIYVYISIYIHIYIHIYMYSYMCIYTYIYIHVYLYIYMYIKYTHMYMYTHNSSKISTIDTSIPTRMSMYIYTSIYM